jgi:hypothetical protein
VVVDGDPADFPADSAFTTSAGTGAHLAWDAAKLYLSVEHPNVAQGPGYWLVAYFGDSFTGSTSGITIGGQSPALPFAAGHAIVWSTDGSSASLQTWNGVAWVQSAGWPGANGAVADDDVNQRVELSVPLALLGPSPTLDVVVALVDDVTGVTVAGLPSTAFADGAADPDYAEGYAFHPNLAPSPNSYLPVP